MDGRQSFRMLEETLPASSPSDRLNGIHRQAAYN